MTKANKVLILGVDGLDPRMTKHYMSLGLMPNVSKLVEVGTQREDLVLLGGMPTITPPMWTTLATGSYPITHGITCFWNQDPESLDTMVYSLDSRTCQSEQLWNIFAEEANKKTLVWHWPGSSWPPTSQSTNLNVVDGTQPAAVNGGVASVEGEKLFVASRDIAEVGFKAKTAVSSGAGCIIDDLAADEVGSGEDADTNGLLLSGQKHVKNIMLTHEDGEMSVTMVRFDVSNSPIKEATGWANAPEGALEFIMVISGGLERRYGLLVPDTEGIYTTVWLFNSKKEVQPFAIVGTEKMAFAVEETVKINDQLVAATRNYRVLELAPDGSYLRMWASMALDLSCDAVFHPKNLYQQVLTNVGPVPSVTGTGGNDIEFTEKLLLPSWDNYAQWQADVLNYLIEANGYEVIFSHLHNVDAMGHSIMHFCTEQPHGDNKNLARYKKAWDQVYSQTDDYLGRFVHLLDEGWTIFITSDHGLVISSEEIPLLGDPFGVNVGVMAELGYTTTMKDAKGNAMKEIDWSKTRAIATRGNQIWLNLKGRNATGIVEPADQYELERQIIDDLYSYRLGGKRVVSIALRNQDAQILGMGGPLCGDILYWLEENHTRIHGDVLSTLKANEHSSVSPIFIAAGQGIKKGQRVTRVIQEVDFAPTVAAVMGVRMPAQCEGGPAFQIFED